MSTIRFTTEIAEDGTIRPPKGVQLTPGKAEVTVVQRSETAEDSKIARSSLADWAEKHAEHWGNRISSEDVETFTGRNF